MADHVALTEALGDSLGVRVVVEKERRLLLHENVRIHLDRVAGLGDFVELEAVATGPSGPVAERVKIDALKRVLDLSDERLVARSYADLLERRGSGVRQAF